MADLLKDRHFHFIAIGGVGMSAIAKYLCEKGISVSGSDIQESKYTEKLKKAGVEVSVPHNPDLVKEGMTIVCSSAIHQDNPELIRAKELGLEILHRSDILALIGNSYTDNGGYFFGFSGSHGKTTTSGLCSYVLEKGGLKPSFIVGGIINDLGYNAKYGSDNYFSAELDESDGTIVKYYPNILVVNNLEEDHLDFYKNGLPDELKTFGRVISNLKPNSKVIINVDSFGCRELMKLYPSADYITYGLNNADYCAKNISYSPDGVKFDIEYKGEIIDTLELSLHGQHNVYNALSVYIAIKTSGVDVKSIREYFKTFSGMGRRYQFVGEFDGIKIYDDYAHHPSEIKTTLESAKNSSSARLVLVFQPHRYSRLQGLWKDFLSSFDFADKLFITDVFSAGEDKIEGITSENFVKDLKHPDAHYVSGNLEEVSKKVLTQLKPNDIVITMGAGSITKLGNLLLEENNKVKTVGNLK